MRAPNENININTKWFIGREEEEEEEAEGEEEEKAVSLLAKQKT